ncbi:hypothetical protein CBR_g12350 [Chara braunii]|uniref:Uncharacterized protein n=1 Tax=Chara braunii TaxID=69332 RepID=A0A388KRY9_CHABU|nr:hypothetical protein CBR_g12350 [Chara braunii]|eukprot:GBG72782.1 hypothetical protein CBR_g12350 [Chara braunii]
MMSSRRRHRTTLTLEDGTAWSRGRRPGIPSTREEFARLPAAQQVDRVFVPIDAPSSSAAGPKRRQDQPARAGGKRQQLATAPSSSAVVVQALPSSVPPSDRQGRDVAEQSSEATDYDDGAVRYRAGPQHCSRGGAGAFDDQDGEGGGWDGEGGGEEGEGGGEEEEGGGEGDDGNEGDAEGEDDGMDEERDDVGEEVEDIRSSQFHRRHQNESRGRREDDACRVSDAVDAGGQPAASRGMSLSYDQTKDGRDEPGSWGKQKRGEASTSPASRTKQARADIVNEARGALTASQEARAPRKTGNNAIACDESAKDIAYLTKFVDILVKDERFECRLEKPRATHRTNRDMYHKLGPKRLKVWGYLFRDAPDGRHDGGYIYRKAKVTEALKHYHGVLTGAFETFVARCEILRFDLHKDKLTFKDYADLAKSGEGFNPVDSEEDSSDSDLEIEKDTNATGWCGKSAAMEHNVKGYGPGQSEGCSNVPPANNLASGVDRVVCTPVEDDEDDDLDIPAQPTKLAPGDPIPPRFCAVLAGTSEMVSESTAGMGVTGMSLHPPTCTSKGDAHCTTTLQGGVTGDDRNGGNAGGSPRSRNIEDMTTDDEDGVEGGKGVSDPTRVENEG